MKAVFTLFVAVFLLGLSTSVIIVTSQASSSSEEIIVIQSHTRDFWQVNGDDAGTQPGELGFIWKEWLDYTDYDFVTMYKLIVNTTFIPYTPCEQGDSCTNRYAHNPKHLGRSDMGYVAIPSSVYDDYRAKLQRSSSLRRKRMDLQSTSDVQYFDWSWYSIPLRGQCDNQTLKGNNCGFYPVCAVKTIQRSCLNSKPGWRHNIDSGDGDYYTIWPIFQLAFQETDPSLGGCPDVTHSNFSVCTNSSAILRDMKTYGKIDRPTADQIIEDSAHEFAPRSPPSSIYSSPSYYSTPLIGIDYENNSICQISLQDSEEVCKPLIYFEPSLSYFSPSVLMSSPVNGIVFFHLKSKAQASACEPPRILGYNFEANAFVYNFTIDYDLDWFDIDMDDGFVVGLISPDRTVFRMEVVTISLVTNRALVVTPYAIYNNSRSLERIITYDSSNNTLYFFGESDYLDLPCLVSYTIRSFTHTEEEVREELKEEGREDNSPAIKLYNPAFDATTAFPIILLNTTSIYSLVFSPSSGSLLVVTQAASDEYPVLIGEMDTKTAILLPGFSELKYNDEVEPVLGSGSYDQVGNLFTFCMEVENPRSYGLVTYDFNTRKLDSKPVNYHCNRLPYQYLNY